MFCGHGLGLDEFVEIGGVYVSRNSDKIAQDGIERTLTQIASGQGLTSSGTATKLIRCSWFLVLATAAAAMGTPPQLKI